MPALLLLAVTSRVLGDRGRGGADVATAELDRVNDQWRDLVQRDALFPTRFERKRLRVRGETFGTEPTEEPHHREVELTVASVRGGIDQPAATVGVDQTVARPQVAV